MLRRIRVNAIDLWPQWLASVTVTILAMSLGLVAGWTSPYLAKFTSKESSISITESEASWVASSLPLGRLLGAVCGSLAAEYLGSKISLVLAGLPLIISWVCVICATSATWLYLFRIFAGTSLGMFFSCFPIFIGEISAAHIRGALVGVVINGLPIGTLIGNIMGPQMSNKWFGVISLLVTSVYVLTFPCLPKSPYYLIRRNSMENAAKSIRFYHRKSDVMDEMNAIEMFIKESDVVTLRERLKLMKEPKNQRAFMMIVVLFFFMQFSGLNSIIFYMEIIVRNAKVTLISPSTVVIIVSLASIINGWISIYAIDRIGRKFLLIVSSLSVSIGMIMLGTHFYLLQSGYDSETIQPLAIISLLIFSMFCIGLIPVPSTLLAELFPITLKTIAGFTGSFVSACFAFISSKTFQPMVNLLTEQYVFWIYAIIMISSIFYSAFYVPETKGKTLKITFPYNCNENINMDTEKENVKKNVTWPQWIGGIGIGLLLMQIGLLAGWSSPYIAQLLSGESIILITTQEASLIISFMNVGRIIGGILGAIFITYLGSRKTIVLCSIPISMCWIFIIIANNINWLYSARFFGGFYMGMCYNCFSLYLGEIADSNIRGALVVVGMIGMSSGMLFISIMGSYLSLLLSSSVNLILSTILMILFIWLPDTPHHLIFDKDIDKVKKSILWYHRNCNVDVEYTNLKQFIESSSNETTWQTMKKFNLPHIRKALIITGVLFFYMQFSGVNTVLFYMETILKTAKVTVIKPSIVVIIIAISGIFGSLLSIRLIDTYGRKFLMCICSFAVTIALTTLGIHFQLLELNVDPNKIQWIPISSFILFEIAVCAGLLSVPSTVVGEIFPPNVKCIAASICSILAAIFSFLAASTYQFFIDLMTEKYTYWMYALVIITAVPITIVFLPETKGKTLQEIQDELISQGSKKYEKEIDVKV
ncbi:hypothetical protein M0802_009760 [Mischocyttarus mexicanus]|nr:hypothetical protein M0802_009760 [Mischocyttarus mexicanus]